MQLQVLKLSRPSLRLILVRRTFSFRSTKFRLKNTKVLPSSILVDKRSKMPEKLVIYDILSYSGNQPVRWYVIEDISEPYIKGLSPSTIEAKRGCYGKLL